jgi:hypothetical protein
MNIKDLLKPSKVVGIAAIAGLALSGCSTESKTPLEFTQKYQGYHRERPDYTLVFDSKELSERIGNPAYRINSKRLEDCEGNELEIGKEYKVKAGYRIMNNPKLVEIRPVN